MSAQVRVATGWLAFTMGAFLTAFGHAALANDASLDTFIETQMRERKIPGMAVAVIRSGKVEALRTYGKKDRRGSNRKDRKERKMCPGA